MLCDFYWIVSKTLIVTFKYEPVLTAYKMGNSRRKYRIRLHSTKFIYTITDSIENLSGTIPSKSMTAATAIKNRFTWLQR